MERKVKYDYAFKLECVELVLKKHHSNESVSLQKGLSASNIRKWVLLYKTYGTTGLLACKNQSYTADFKAKVLQAIAKERLSLSESRIRFKIPSDSVIIKWQKDFANFGLAGLLPKPKGRPKSMSNSKGKKHKPAKPLTREEELLLENESLRCELDILKKLHALIQAEENAKKRRS